jgi:type IV secretory pathway VirJ component
LCAPFISQNNSLITAPALKNNWRVVWTDQPPTETAVFIKNLNISNTRIADYNTALDKVLLDEASLNFAQTATDTPIMPVVEMPTSKPSDTVTLFYSGDGGWRDLDKAVAAQMVALNYPVVGVDVLRYFWQHQSPEKAASDLAATMNYYRKHWGTKRFVLAGYSFGADIMPFIYNRLSPSDQDSVPLLVLLALANTADFEIHVSGWLGKDSGEQALAPELAKIPNSKLLCIFGREEEIETACRQLTNTEAVVLELEGGHHFDEDYPKLTKQILAVYQQHGIH